jgi:DNA-binding SARP family transcriptional activator/tetratricopeptide (TPR) repeat protein/DNA-binding transcriptional ArsR family regulator
MAIEFALLGPLTLTIGGGQVALPGGKQQLLLTALLLARGRRVPSGELMEDLWIDPPASARVNLRGYVKQLRDALGPYRERLTWTATSGYLLAVQPQELDVDTFEAEVRRAADAEPQPAMEILGLALGRWRGAAAEGLPRHGRIGQELAELDGSRAAVVQRFAIACRQAGQPGEAVAALRALTADQPAREPGWAALAETLSQCGDTEAALAVIAEADTALLATAGRRGGQSLRDAERQLRDSETSQPAAGASLAFPPPVALVGRQRLAVQVESALSDAPAVVLHGSAGVGKSALASQVAWRLSPAYPGGLYYLDMCGSSPGLTPMTADEAIGSLLRAFGGRSDGSTAAQMAELRLKASEQRVLVVLDNVAEAGQVRRLLSVLSDALVIVTSRTMLSTLDVTHLNVGILDPDDSVTLLTRYAGASRFTQAAAQARELAALCGHLPLALRIVGARLARHPEWTLGDMAERLTGEQHRLDELSCDDLAVRTSLAVTGDLLARRSGGPEALSLFDRWGMVCSPVFSLELARALTGAEPTAIRQALDRLAEAGLIEAYGDGRYRMHDLVRLYATERGQADAAQRDMAVHTARCYFLGTARHARDQIRSDRQVDTDDTFAAPSTVDFAGAAEALRWLETERENLVAAAHTAAHDGTAEGALFAIRMCAELYPFLPMRGYHRELREVAKGALLCARRLGNRADEAASLTYFAVAQSRLGEADQALSCLRLALSLREADGQQQAVAVTLDHLGVLLAAAGRLAESRTSFLRALTMHRRHGDRRRVGVTLNNLADVLLQLGQTDAALVHLRESLRLRREIGDELGLGITMLTIGQVYASSGQYQQAFQLLDRALPTARATGNREAEWRVLTVRAEVHRVTGHKGAALDDLRQALALSEETGDADATRQVRRAMAGLNSRRGR